MMSSVSSFSQSCFKKCVVIDPGLFKKRPLRWALPSYIPFISATGPRILIISSLSSIQLTSGRTTSFPGSIKYHKSSAQLSAQSAFESSKRMLSLYRLPNRALISSSLRNASNSSGRWLRYRSFSSSTIFPTAQMRTRWVQ